MTKAEDIPLTRVLSICKPIKMLCLGRKFSLRIERDNILKSNGRIFIQVQYVAPCVKTGEEKLWNSRKWYLSKFMTEDEIVKTCYAAFESCIRHEVMEGFTYGGKIIFNPHVNFRELLEISNNESLRRTD